MEIERDGGNATVHKALVGLRDRFKIDVDGGPDLSVHGNLVDHEIERDGDTVATVSKGRSRGYEVVPGQGPLWGRDRARSGRRPDSRKQRVHRRHDPRLSAERADGRRS
jgi:hypothetical protein